jgi:hypothetical protein
MRAQLREIARTGHVDSREPSTMSDSSEEAWRRSTYCSTGSCVEVAILDSRIAVRDSKDKNGPMLVFNDSEWADFLRGACNGEFDFVPDHH